MKKLFHLIFMLTIYGGSAFIVFRIFTFLHSLL